MTLDMIVRILSIFDSSGDFMWRTDGQYAPVSFFILCSDFFWWAVSDAEKITEDNLDLLETTFMELKQLGDALNKRTGSLYSADSFTGLLFCARVRKMRPQGAYYVHLPESLWSLFDACGPERPVDDLNPQEKPMYG